MLPGYNGFSTSRICRDSYRMLRWPALPCLLCTLQALLLCYSMALSTMYTGSYWLASDLAEKIIWLLESGAACLIRHCCDCTHAGLLLHKVLPQKNTNKRRPPTLATPATHRYQAVHTPARTGASKLPQNSSCASPAAAASELQLALTETRLGLWLSIS